MGEFGDSGTSVTESRTAEPLKPSYRAIITVAVIGAVMFAGGWWLYLQSSGDGADSDRRATLIKAQEFAVAFNTFDSSMVEEYEERLDPLLTDRLRQDPELAEHLTSLRDEAELGTQVTSEATFRVGAIEELANDTAVVIVAVDVVYGLTVNDQTVPPLQPAEQTWRVTVVRSGDEWRIDAFDPVRHASDISPVTPELPDDGGEDESLEGR